MGTVKRKPFKPKPTGSKAMYGIYKGEEFLDVGTKAEMAEKFGVTEQTVHYWATPNNHKRALNKDGKEGTKGGRIVAIALGKDAFEYSVGPQNKEKHIKENRW